MNKTLTAIVATIIGGLVIIILNFALTKSDKALGGVERLGITVYQNKENIAVLESIAKNTDRRLVEIDKNVKELLKR